MPYVTQQERDWLDVSIFGVDAHLTPGQLNYLVTQIMLRQKPTNYDQHNEIIGVLESVKLEFYRRAVVPYEERKKFQNGEVYV